MIAPSQEDIYRWCEEGQKDIKTKFRLASKMLRIKMAFECIAI